MIPSENFPERLLSLRSNLGLSQSDMGEKLGLSLNYISSLERGRKDPSDAVIKHVTLLEEAIRLGYGRAQEEVLREGGAPYHSSSQCRMIPVVSWAHAGEAESYEELPESWQEQVPTECRDNHAFAVQLKGVSMVPVFLDEDVLVLTPSEEPYNGCLVVARFKDDGVICRRVEFEKEMVRLVPENDRYEAREYSREDFSWIYPVWGRWTQIWK